MGSGGKIAAIFILSLFVSTFFISFFQTGLYGYTDINNIELPLSINGISTTDDFTGSNCLLNIAHYEMIGLYSCVSDGIELVTGTIRNKQKIDTDKEGTFKNTYSIKYLNGTYYYIIIAQQATPIPTTIYLEVNQDGLHIPVNYFGLFIHGDSWFSPLENANIEDSNIETDYNGKTNSLTVNFNGNKYNISSEYLPPLYGGQLNYYEGISTIGGYKLESLTSNYLPPTGSVLNGLSMVIDLIWRMLLLTTYSFPYDVIPLYIQIILISPQEFMIVVGLAMFLREG
jgi:hypothetical protein